MGFFPIDDETISYLRRSGRDEAMCETVKLFCQAQGLWRDETTQITYTDVLELDMGIVQPSLAGPKRPQDKILLSDMKGQFHLDLCNTYAAEALSYVDFQMNGKTETIGDGSVVIVILAARIRLIHRSWLRLA